jgi:hypothetical protein
MPIRSRILIADDHKLVAELFQRLLARDFDVVGIATAMPCRIADTIVASTDRSQSGTPAAVDIFL